MMDERYSVIDFELSYLDEMAEMEQICFPNDPWSRQMFLESAENDCFIITLVKDMQLSKLVAYSLIYCAADQADLANIAVLPECRGQKLGRELLEITMKKANEIGASEVFLEVRESNVPARCLYNASEFAEIGRRKRYYANPREDAIIMVRKL